MSAERGLVCLRGCGGSLARQGRKPQPPAEGSPGNRAACAAAADGARPLANDRRFRAQLGLCRSVCARSATANRRRCCSRSRDAPSTARAKRQAWPRVMGRVESAYLPHRVRAGGKRELCPPKAPERRTSARGPASLRLPGANGIAALRPIRARNLGLFIARRAAGARWALVCSRAARRGRRRQQLPTSLSIRRVHALVPRGRPGPVALETRQRGWQHRRRGSSDRRQQRVDSSNGEHPKRRSGGGSDRSAVRPAWRMCSRQSASQRNALRPLAARLEARPCVPLCA